MPDPVPADQPMNGGVALPVAAPVFILLRVTQSPRRADGWALALISKGITPFMRWLDGMCELYVESDDIAAAVIELDAIDDEERDTRRARIAQRAIAEPAVSKRATVGAAMLALLLLVFFGVTGPRAGDSSWFIAGASDAERVLHGEWWRTVTALTLHADSAHVISNVALGTLAVGAVMRSEGVGWGAALVFAAGTAGNAINAWAHQSLHSSVGFSTAIFGAIGILGGLAFVRSRRHIASTRPAWTALAGVLALLALLGTSEDKRVDLFAHLFGALAGVGLGVVTALFRWRPQTAGAQWMAGLGVAASVVGAWWVALT